VSHHGYGRKKLRSSIVSATPRLKVAELPHLPLHRTYQSCTLPLTPEAPQRPARLQRAALLRGIMDIGTVAFAKPHQPTSTKYLIVSRAEIGGSTSQRSQSLQMRRSQTTPKCTDCERTVPPREPKQWLHVHGANGAREKHDANRLNSCRGRPSPKPGIAIRQVASRQATACIASPMTELKVGKVTW
jgi:hypothetical protein